ncbi:hypothetical protein DL96DRAFT_1589087 [Flagelloscypha sp. PMI_526]|nr:hypothetical protein DL96DRAFT_1589087 [Flagelloscypha sp. PMI_526]
MFFLGVCSFGNVVLLLPFFAVLVLASSHFGAQGHETACDLSTHGIQSRSKSSNSSSISCTLCLPMPGTCQITMRRELTGTTLDVDYAAETLGEIQAVQERRISQYRARCAVFHEN